jgi:hypothetical protein
MSSLAQAAAYFGLAVVVVALVGWVLYRLFGSSVLGLPGLLGVLIVLAAAKLGLGVGDIALMVGGLLLLLLVIGAAMSIGSPKPKMREPRQKA